MLPISNFSQVEASLITTFVLLNTSGTSSTGTFLQTRTRLDGEKRIPVATRITMARQATHEDENGLFSWIADGLAEATHEELKMTRRRAQRH